MMYVGHMKDMVMKWTWGEEEKTRLMFRWLTVPLTRLGKLRRTDVRGES